MPEHEVSRRLQRYVRAAYGPEEALAGAPPPDDADELPAAEGRARSADRRRPRPTGRRWRTRPAVMVRAGALVLLAGVLAAAWVMLRPAPDGPAVPLVDPVPVAASPSVGAEATAEGPEPVGPTVTAAPDESPAPEGVVVHVAGAVVDPGVVELPAGARVQAAIDAAGGAEAEADLDTLNLAAVLVDGQQVYVPTRGENPGVGAPGPAPPGGTSGDGGGTPTAGAGPVDLNLADAAALDTLPGIGPALAERILTHREQNGPFTSVEQLTDVSGIGPATMERLRDLVTV